MYAGTVIPMLRMALIDQAQFMASLMAGTVGPEEVVTQFQQTLNCVGYDSSTSKVDATLPISIYCPAHLQGGQEVLRNRYCSLQDASSNYIWHICNCGI